MTDAALPPTEPRDSIAALSSGPTVLVLGGTGILGRALVCYLSDRPGWLTRLGVKWMNRVIASIAAVEVVLENTVLFERACKPRGRSLARVRATRRLRRVTSAPGVHASPCRCCIVHGHDDHFGGNERVKEFGQKSRIGVALPGHWPPMTPHASMTLPPQILMLALRAATDRQHV